MNWDSQPAMEVTDDNPSKGNYHFMVPQASHFGIPVKSNTNSWLVEANRMNNFLVPSTASSTKLGYSNVNRRRRYESLEHKKIDENEPYELSSDSSIPSKLPLFSQVNQLPLGNSKRMLVTDSENSMDWDDSSQENDKLKKCIKKKKNEKGEVNLENIREQLRNFKISKNKNNGMKINDSDCDMNADGNENNREPFSLFHSFLHLFLYPIWYLSVDLTIL